jgi:hypothetical protein
MSNTMMTQLLLISGQEIDGQPVSCTGNQLALLIDSIAMFLKGCRWYACDVNTNTGYPRFVGANNCAEIGDTETMITTVQECDQFIGGVFVAIHAQYWYSIDSRSIHTEGPETMYSENSVVEIRAFDTSYFEVYTKSDEVFSVAHNRFGGRPQQIE